MFERNKQIHLVAHLYLRYCGDEELVSVLPLRVEAVAGSWPDAAGAAAPLVGVGLRDGEDGERVHADARVEHLKRGRGFVNTKEDGTVLVIKTILWFS